MSMDDGDEVGKSMARAFLHVSAKIFTTAARKMMNSRGSSAADKQRNKNYDEVLGEAVEAGGPESLLTDGGVEYRKLLVPSNFEARLLLERLSAEGIEWYTHPDDIDGRLNGKEPLGPCFNNPSKNPAEAVEAMLAEGAYRTTDKMVPVYVPLREIGAAEGLLAADEISDETMSLIDTFDHIAIREARKLEKACKKNAPYVPKIDFNPKSPDNFKLEFKTLSTDRGGKWFSKKLLSELDVPHTIEAIPAEGRAIITIDPRHATPVRELIDELCGHVPGMNLERFPNYSELKALAVDKDAIAHICQFTLENPVLQDLMQTALEETSINYEVDINPETQEAVYTISAEEMAEKGYEVPVFAAALNRLKEALDPRVVTQRAAARKQSRVPDNTKFHKLTQLGKDMYAKVRRRNPEKDQIAARKSAEARKRDNIEQKKTQNRSK